MYIHILFVGVTSFSYFDALMKDMESSYIYVGENGHI